MQIEEAIPVQSFITTDPAFLVMAEQELAAFARAVRELFGTEQERHSIEDWMQELESMDWAPEESDPDWRHVSVAAARRLADRVCMMR